VRLSLTRWTELGRARDGDREAWERLAAKYRPPVVAFLVSMGLRDAAQDLAQEVFVELMERGILGRADRGQGRFRNLLFGVTRNVGLRHLAQAGKLGRGGPAVQPLPEGQLPAVTPEQEALFEREWTLNLLDLALARLEREHPHYHRAIAGFFLEGASQAALAQAAGKTAGDIRNYVYRGKKKLLGYLREEAWETCADPADYEQEIARLRETLGG